MDEQPKMQCPKCRAEYDDFDGLGVLYCEQCGYEDDVITVLRRAVGHLEGKTVLEVVDERDELKADKERLENQFAELKSFISEEVHSMEGLIQAEKLAGNTVKESNYNSERVAFMVVLNKLAEIRKHPAQEPTNEEG